VGTKLVKSETKCSYTTPLIILITVWRPNPFTVELTSDNTCTKSRFLPWGAQPQQNSNLSQCQHAKRQSKPASEVTTQLNLSRHVPKTA
jgi:hypothetical protein